MKPQGVAIVFATIAVFSMCCAPTHAEVVDGVPGKWKAAGGATIFEVFQDGRYKSTVNGIVVESGKINASNGIWNIQADSGRVDNGSFTLTGSDLQLKGNLITTVWNRISSPTESSTSKATTESSGSSVTSSSTASASKAAESTSTHLSDKEKAIQRFNAKYGARAGGWVRNPPGGVMNDRQARKFWRGH